jgi:hypothetical protein
MPRKPRPFTRTIRGVGGDSVYIDGCAGSHNLGNAFVRVDPGGSLLSPAGLRALSKACLEAVAVLEQRKKEQR